MLGYFLLAVIIIPLIEVALLIKVGQYIGSATTILLIIFTGVIGAYLARQQGFKVLWELRYTLSQQIMPGFKMLEGLFVLIGGMFLLTPGLITDAIGLLLLIPSTRHFLVSHAIKKLEDYFLSGRIKIYRR